MKDGFRRFFLRKGLSRSSTSFSSTYNISQQSSPKMMVFHIPVLSATLCFTTQLL